MRDKARVERPMPYVRDSFWRGREFASLPQMQAEAVRWCLQVAGRRACRPLQGAAPAAVFDAVEKDALRPLPAEPFVLATWATARIGPDIHAQVDRVLYSVPWRHIGKTADVRLTATMVQFFIGGQLVKTHPRKIRGKQTDFADYPPVMWNQRCGCQARQADRLSAAGVLAQECGEAREPGESLIGIAVVPGSVRRGGIADAVQTLCFQGAIKPVFVAGGTFVGVACDVVEEFPVRPLVVGPVRSRTAGQAVDLRDIG